MDIAAATDATSLKFSKATQAACDKAVQARREKAAGAAASVHPREVPAFKATADVSAALFCSPPSGGVDKTKAEAEGASGAASGASSSDEGTQPDDYINKALEYFIADEKTRAELKDIVGRMCIKHTQAEGAATAEGKSGASAEEKPADKAITDEEKGKVTSAIKTVINSFPEQFYAIVQKLAAISDAGKGKDALTDRQIAAAVQAGLCGQDAVAVAEDAPIDKQMQRSLSLFQVGKDTIDSVAGVTTFNGDSQALIVRMENVTLESLFRNGVVAEESASVMDRVYGCVGCGPTRKAAGEIVKEKRGMCG